MSVFACIICFVVGTIFGVLVMAFVIAASRYDGR